VTRGLPVLLLALLIAVGGAVAFIAIRSRPIEPLPVISTVPAFTLIDQEGKPYPSSNLAGKVWIADAIFTRCPSVCPLMTDRLEDLEYKTRGFDDVRFVSFSVDPEHDSPEALRQFGGEHSVPFTRWKLLTGQPETLASVLRDGFHFYTGNENGSPTHDVHVVLVDRKMRVRGVYDSTDDKALERLAADVGILATHR
jgi:protein SCO1/2